MYVDPERRWALREDRACRGTDPELWFSDDRQDQRQAKALCQTCPVLSECRRDALGEGYGIFGGLDADGRRAERKRLVEEAVTWPTEKRLYFGRLIAGVKRRWGNWTRVRELTGIQSDLAEVLLKEWEAHQQEVRRERIARQQERFDALELPGRPPQPPRPGRKDAWVWHERVWKDADVEGVSSDGRYYYVTVGPRSVKTMYWLPVRDVHIYSSKAIPKLEKNEESEAARRRQRGWAA